MRLIMEEQIKKILKMIELGQCDVNSAKEQIMILVNDHVKEIQQNLSGCACGDRGCGR